jgi:NAD(P)-dependent dehydrogenase (short-subunit alcohol dehydrogenase family)
MNINDSSFLVTGGSSGLGEACVRRLAAGGGTVVIADVQEPDPALADEFGDAIRFAHTDVTNSVQVQAAVDMAVEANGGLQGVINCAGVAIAALVLSKRGPHDLDAFARVITVNLIGTFNVIRLAGDAMSKGEPNAAGERGVIINTASVAAFDGQVGQAASPPPKGA